MTNTGNNTPGANLEDQIRRAAILVEALPYISEFRGETIVIKYGGSVMENDELIAQVASDIVLLQFVGVNVVVVHGGGKEISEWLKRVGKQSKFIGGLRVTDSGTMEITEMVLSGKVSGKITSYISQHGGRAVGLSGKDSQIITAEQRLGDKGEDLGLVGEVVSIDPTLLHELCELGYIPTLSSVGETKDGRTLNLNADTVAGAVAGALGARKLIYLTDVRGLLLDGELQSTLRETEARAALTHRSVTGGMIPKLQTAIKAIEAGVSQVHIIDGSLPHAVILELFTAGGIGTMIEREERE